MADAVKLDWRAPGRMTHLVRCRCGRRLHLPYPWQPSEWTCPTCGMGHRVVWSGYDPDGRSV
jgi:hypothetical protein